jgi:hypothetical protein
MEIVCFTSTADGGSQFVEIEFPVDNASTDAWGHTARRSATLPAQSTMVTEMPEGLSGLASGLPASASLRPFRHTRSRNQRREDAPVQQRRGVPRRRCRQPRPSHPHHRRPGPGVVRPSAARSQSRRLIGTNVGWPSPADGLAQGAATKDAEAFTLTVKRGRLQHIADECRFVTWRTSTPIGAISLRAARRRVPLPILTGYGARDRRDQR